MNNVPVPASGSAQASSKPTGSKDILTAAKGGGISFAGRVFEYVVRFAFGVLVARFIGVEQYGLYTLATTVSLIASNLAMLGLQTAMVRYLPPAIREKDSAAIWGIVRVCVGLPAVISLLLGVGLYLLAAPTAVLLFNDPRMVPLLKITSVLIPLDALGLMAYGITISYKQPKYAVITNNILSPLVKLFCSLGFLAVGFSTQGVLYAQVMASAAGLAVFAYFINSLLAIRSAGGGQRSYSKELLRYGLPVHLGWMVTTLRSTLSTLVLGFLGLTTGVGLYAAASRLSTLGNMFYLSIGNISTPIIADLHSQKNTAQMKTYYQTTTRWLVMFNLPLFLTSMFFAEPLLSIFGDDFTSGAASVMILAFGALAHTCTGLGANILDMTDHPKVNTANSVVMVIITILLNIVLVPAWDLIGAALASAISTALINVICLVEVWIILKMQPYNRGILKPLSAAVVAALATYLFNLAFDLPSLLHLLAGSAVLWGSYALALFLMKFPAEDRLVIERFTARFRMKMSVPRHAPRNL